MWIRDDWSWWAWFVMSLGMVAFWALVAWTVVTVVGRAQGTATRRTDAENTLRERFARGEIDEVEYRARLGVLRDGGATSAVSRGTSDSRTGPALK